MNTVLERLAKLLTIKSLVTLMTTIVFCYLAVTGQVVADQFLMIFSTIIAFYFGTQFEKNNS
jgi:hypothetical protein